MSIPKQPEKLWKMLQIYHQKLLCKLMSTLKKLKLENGYQPLFAFDTFFEKNNAYTFPPYRSKLKISQKYPRQWCKSVKRLPALPAPTQKRTI